MWHGKVSWMTKLFGEQMKKTIAIFFCIFVTGCSTVHKNAQTAAEPASAPAIQAPERIAQQAKEAFQPGYGDLIRDIQVSPDAFSPAQGQVVDLSFKLQKKAVVTVSVYDPDNTLISHIVEQVKLGPGRHQLKWNGRDDQNQIVPDEAYYFTVSARDDAGNKEVYDPTVFSGGKEHDIIFADFDMQNHTIAYSMPEKGRVMIRMGIQGGPMLNQLVDWQPRTKGAVTEYWNGKDTDNLVDIFNHPKFKMIISYITFPQNAVISFGNKAYSYLEYKKSSTADAIQKPQRDRSVENQSHHFSLARTMDYSPGLTLNFSNAKEMDENGIPILRSKALVSVDLVEKDKPVFKEQQFEICFFLDHAFYAEDETGYTPFNWVWDLNNVKEGEYLLTVNISSFKDQVGVISRKVKVVK
jgi:hypothetical protein